VFWESGAGPSARGMAGSRHVPAARHLPLTGVVHAPDTPPAPGAHGRDARRPGRPRPCEGVTRRPGLGSSRRPTRRLLSPILITLPGMPRSEGPVGLGGVMKAKVLIYLLVFAGVCGYAWWSMRRDEAASREKREAVSLAWVWFHALSGRQLDKALENSEVPFDWNGVEQVAVQPRLRELLIRNFSSGGPALPAWRNPDWTPGTEFRYRQSLDPEATRLVPSGAIAVNIDEANPPANASGPRRCRVFVRLGDRSKVIGFRDLTGR
jgi:hypothetical protein